MLRGSVQCVWGVNAAAKATLNDSLHHLHACFASNGSSRPVPAAAAAADQAAQNCNAGCSSPLQASRVVAWHFDLVRSSSSTSSSISPQHCDQQHIQQPHRHAGIHRPLRTQSSSSSLQQQQQQTGQLDQQLLAAQRPPVSAWVGQQQQRQHRWQTHQQQPQWQQLQQLRCQSSSSIGEDDPTWTAFPSSTPPASPAHPHEWLNKQALQQLQRQQQQQRRRMGMPVTASTVVPLPGTIAPIRRAPNQRPAASAASRVAPAPAWANLEQVQQVQQQLWQQQQQHVQQQAQRAVVRSEVSQPTEERFAVHALHLGAGIEVGSFALQYKQDFQAVINNPPHRDHSIFQLVVSSDDQDMLNPETDEEANPRYMIVYRYGSVIFMNVPEGERKRQLALLRPFIVHPQGQEAAAAAAAAAAASDDNASTLRTDKTIIVVRPHMEQWSDLEPDQIVLQGLDLSGLRVISHVLSQSVALDYFNWRVDSAIQQFTPYLTAVAQTGQCDTVKEAGLLQLIADNSLLYTDVVTKIGLLDISPTAWKHDKHYNLWYDLRVDYEIERRFDAINRKLGPMLENAKFLLDVRAEQKSSGAEWIIIALICLEVIMNGAGHLAAYFWQ